MIELPFGIASVAVVTALGLAEPLEPFPLLLNAVADVYSAPVYQIGIGGVTSCPFTDTYAISLRFFEIFGVLTERKAPCQLFGFGQTLRIVTRLRPPHA